ncbi:hypothetical protein [Bacillus sp. NPDC094106]|uniref:hypothetical protein n=1 Tax=Bacillus sp. NPDC094106 TaxID=3363949 RepID=UPI0037FA5270
MKTVDAKQTEEILQGLQEDGVNVTVENVDEYLQKQGVLVKVHVGRLRNYVEVTPGLFGVDVSQSEELDSFFKNYIRNGRLNFIPNDYEKKLRSIEAKVRKMKATLAIGYDNEYLPIDIYKDFSKYVKEARVEYFEVRDNILANWIQLIRIFEDSLQNSLEQMGALNKEAIQRSIMSRIPTQEKYEESFYLRTSLKAFPVIANVNLFDEEIAEEVRESIRQESVKGVYEIMGNVLNDAFQVVNRSLSIYEERNRLTQTSLNSIKNSSYRIKKKNLFKNAFVDEIADDLYTLSGTPQSDIAEVGEIILAKIYGYSYEIGIQNEINLKDSVLSEEELEIICSTFNKQTQEAMNM